MSGQGAELKRDVADALDVGTRLTSDEQRELAEDLLRYGLQEFNRPAPRTESGARSAGRRRETFPHFSIVSVWAFGKWGGQNTVVADHLVELLVNEIAYRRPMDRFFKDSPFEAKWHETLKEVAERGVLTPLGEELASRISERKSVLKFLYTYREALKKGERPLDPERAKRYAAILAPVIAALLAFFGRSSIAVAGGIAIAVVAASVILAPLVCRSDEPSIAPDAMALGNSEETAPSTRSPADAMALQSADAGATVEDCEQLTDLSKQNCLFKAADAILESDPTRALTLYDASLAVATPSGFLQPHMVLRFQALDGKAAATSKLGRDKEALALLRARLDEWQRFEPNFRIQTQREPDCFAEITLLQKLSGAAAAYDEVARCEQIKLPQVKAAPSAFAYARVAEETGHLPEAMTYYNAATGFELGVTSVVWEHAPYRWKHLVPPSTIEAEARAGVLRVLRAMEQKGQSATTGDIAIWRNGDGVFLRALVPEGCSIRHKKWKPQLEVVTPQGAKRSWIAEPAERDDDFRQFGISLTAPKTTVRLHSQWLETEPACDGKIQLAREQDLCFEPAGRVRLGACS